MRTHHTKAVVALTLVGALAVGACDFNISNPNNPPPIGPNATPAQVQSAAIGLLVALRADYPNWVLKAAIMGREGYRFDAADPRFVTELLRGPKLDPSNNAFGGGQWQPEFRTIHSGYAILNVIGSAQIPDSQKNAVRGYVQTIQALSFLNLLNAHIQDSIPIDVNHPLPSLAPFVTNDSAYKHVVSLLDSAAGWLDSATIFPFDPGPGFTGFNTPATFRHFNRALMARVRAYQASLGALPPATYPSAWSACAACWDSVLTALNESFIEPAASMDFGVYNAFSTGNQDAPNGLAQDPSSAINVVHPLVRDSVEKQTGGLLDDRRYLAKVTPRGSILSYPNSSLSSDLSWIRYPSPNSSIPIIRNEELFLLRAEANWFALTGDKNQAIADLDFVRTNSGGLDPTTVTAASTDAAFVGALLHERLYSLLYEGGHRWIDMRRYGRLDQLPIDEPPDPPDFDGDVIFPTLPINIFEVEARPQP